MLRLPLNALLPLLVAGSAAITGCSSAPRSPAAAAPGIVTIEQRSADAVLGGAIAEVAMDLVGTPYLYGGTDPLEGFDCSGLVYYVYGQAGYSVPRTSREQFRAARKISVDDADPGDLVFFQDQTKLSHVGIYLGEGRFVHAPASGENVAVGSLDSQYYQEQLVAVGRLLPH
jgi:cell wall-associated NlpC family hydrolase